MPLAPGKPYTVIDGKQEDLSGVAMLWPELNQQEVLQGTWDRGMASRGLVSL
jgi:hypothetical protein